MLFKMLFKIPFKCPPKCSLKSPSKFCSRNLFKISSNTLEVSIKSPQNAFQNAFQNAYQNAHQNSYKMTFKMLFRMLFKMLLKMLFEAPSKFWLKTAKSDPTRGQKFKKAAKKSKLRKRGGVFSEISRRFGEIGGRPLRGPATKLQKISSRGYSVE